MGSKTHRLAALAASVALCASLSSGLPCLAMPAAATDHGCCPPEAGFEASPAACCDERAESTAVPPAPPAAADSPHSLHTEAAPVAPPSLADPFGTPIPSSPPAINLRI